AILRSAGRPAATPRSFRSPGWRRADSWRESTQPRDRGIQAAGVDLAAGLDRGHLERQRAVVRQPVEEAFEVERALARKQVAAWLRAPHGRVEVLHVHVGDQPTELVRQVELGVEREELGVERDPAARVALAGTADVVERSTKRARNGLDRESQALLFRGVEQA